MSTGESKRIAERIQMFILENDLNSYQGGILYEGQSAKGRHHWAVDMGTPATMDGTFQVYNKNFIVANITPKYGRMTFKGEDELFKFLHENFATVEYQTQVKKTDIIQKVSNVLEPFDASFIDELKRDLDDLVMSARKEYA